ncbi:MAG: sialidase family protein [Acidimicrobiales bacterium]
MVESPRPVTTDPNPVRLFVSPALAVDPKDPSTVVMAVGDARNGGCGVRVSQDGGLSWRTTAPNLLPPDQDFCIHRNFGPVMAPAFGSDGTLYVAMSGSATATGHPNGPITPLLARSTDLGLTHDTFTVAKTDGFTYTPPGGGPTRSGFYQWRLPSMAVDPTDPNKLYMGWRLWNGGIDDVSFRAFPQRAYIASSSDGGRTWSDPVDVLRATFDDAQAAAAGLSFSGDLQTHADTPSMVVGSDGTVYGFTKERPNAAQGTPAPKSRLFMFRSADGGATWTTKVINDGVDQIDNPSVAISAGDTLYLTYAARGARTPTGEPSNPSEAYFTRSTDRGETWSEPMNITDDDPARRTDQYFPNVSVAPNGRVDVAWFDFRNDPFFTPGESGNMGTAVGERYWDVYYAYSNDGGATWSPNIRATDRMIDGSVGVTFNRSDIRAPIALASTDKAAYLAWADSRVGGTTNEAEDAFFTRIRFDQPTPLGTSTGGTNAVAAGFAGAAITLVAGGALLLVALSSSRRGSASSAARSTP